MESATASASSPNGTSNNFITHISSVSVPTPNLAAAIVKAQRSINNVEKESKHFQGYQYASSEAVIAEARKALNSAGLAVTAAEWTFAPNTATVGDESGKTPAGHINVTYSLIHESGEERVYHTTTAVIPERGRPLDKAQSTALSYSLGYFLRGLLLIPRGEADSVDARVDTETTLPKPIPPKATLSVDDIKKVFQTTLAAIKTMTTPEEQAAVRGAITSLPPGVERDALLKSYNTRSGELKTRAAEKGNIVPATGMKTA
jgi:hypothetical protein